MANSTKDKSIISSNEKSSFWILVIIGLIFIVFTAPALVAIPKEMARGNNGILFVLLFPITGLGICYGGWLMRKKFLFFGPTPLKLSPAVGQVGGQVGGQIELAQPWAKRNLIIRLSCIHTYTSGSGDNSSTHNDILWQQESKPHDRTGGPGSILEFCFDVPADQPLPGKRSRRGRIHWELMVEGLVSFREFKRHWKVPVEKGNGQCSITIPEHHKQETKKAALQQAEASIEKQIQTEVTNSGLDIVSEQGRNKSMSLFACLFGFVFTAVGVFLFYLASQGEGMLWLMAPIFFLVGSAILAYGVFLVGRKLECKLIDGQVHIRRSLFGRILYTREGPLTSVDQLELKVTMTSQSGSVRTEYMALYADVNCTDGMSRQLKLVEGIEGRAAGEAMERKLRGALIVE